jgi:adenosine kinase
MIAYARTCKEKDVSYIFDPGQSIPALPRDLLIEAITGSSLLISNDYELEMIMRATGEEKAKLLTRTSGIVTTLGEDGSLICTLSQEAKISATRPSRVVDPTGAGDAYRAGLIKGLTMGKSLPDAARMGAVCASYAVECYGTQEHIFSEEDFWARYGENFGLEKWIKT